MGQRCEKSYIVGSAAAIRNLAQLGALRAERVHVIFRRPPGRASTDRPELERFFDGLQLRHRASTNWAVSVERRKRAPSDLPGQRRPAWPNLRQLLNAQRCACGATPQEGYRPTRSTDLIRARARPERSAISRSCASMKWRAGASPSRPPSMELGTLRLDVTVPSS